MKYTNAIICLTFLLQGHCIAQNDPHYSMFLYNKLLYNPAYAGSREVTSFNAIYRDQWTGIQGAPKTINFSVDGLAGNFLKDHRNVGLGLSIYNEQIGIENSTSIMAYYAYRIHLKYAVLSLGLRGGVRQYSTSVNQLDPYQQNDPDLNSDIKNALLPNFGAGAYLSGDQFYAGISIPNLLENYYDKNSASQLMASNPNGYREVRGYYLSGGYVYPVSEFVKIQHQMMARYAGNNTHQLPLSCDFNTSTIYYDRLLIGFTYRTDNSSETIIHLQITHHLNIGYAYDILFSDLGSYAKGTHEFVIGFDLIGKRDDIKFANPRFIKNF